MGAVGFLRLQPELLLSIQFNPETVDERYASKSFVKVCGLILNWIRFNLWLTGMLSLAA
jgi:hypothetical protein